VEIIKKQYVINDKDYVTEEHIYTTHDIERFYASWIPTKNIPANGEEIISRAEVHGDCGGQMKGGRDDKM